MKKLCDLNSYNSISGLGMFPSPQLVAKWPIIAVFKESNTTTTLSNWFLATATTAFAQLCFSVMPQENLCQWQIIVSRRSEIFEKWTSFHHRHQLLPFLRALRLHVTKKVEKLAQLHSMTCEIFCILSPQIRNMTPLKSTFSPAQYGFLDFFEILIIVSFSSSSTRNSWA